MQQKCIEKYYTHIAETPQTVWKYVCKVKISLLIYGAAQVEVGYT